MTIKGITSFSQVVERSSWFRAGILGELNKIESEIKTGQDEVELTGIAAPGQCG